MRGVENGWGVKGEHVRMQESSCAKNPRKCDSGLERFGGSRDGELWMKSERIWRYCTRKHVGINELHERMSKFFLS